jgi:hypothetical protein
MAAQQNQVNSMYEMSSYVTNSSIPDLETLTAERRALLTVEQKKSIRKIANILNEISIMYSEILSGGSPTMPTFEGVTDEEILFYRTLFMPPQIRVARSRTTTPFNERNSKWNRETHYAETKKLLRGLPTVLQGLIQNFVMKGGKRRRKTRKSKSRKSKSQKSKRR